MGRYEKPLPDDVGALPMKSARMGIDGKESLFLAAADVSRAAIREAMANRPGLYLNAPC